MKQERLNLERPYSPECVEGEFCELRLLGFLGRWSGSWMITALPAILSTMYQRTLERVS